MKKFLIENEKHLRNFGFVFGLTIGITSIVLLHSLIIVAFISPASRMLYYEQTCKVLSCTPSSSSHNKFNYSMTTNECDEEIYFVESKRPCNADIHIKCLVRDSVVRYTNGCIIKLELSGNDNAFLNMLIALACLIVVGILFGLIHCWAEGTLEIEKEKEKRDLECGNLPSAKSNILHKVEVPCEDTASIYSVNSDGVSDLGDENMKDTEYCRRKTDLTADILYALKRHSVLVRGFSNGDDEEESNGYSQEMRPLLKTVKIDESKSTQLATHDHATSDDGSFDAIAGRYYLLGTKQIDN